MNQLVETEVKLYVPDLNEVIARLDEVGATLSKPRLFEQNIRYENADETFTPNGIVLRLRQDDGARLTYKEPPSAEAAQQGVLSRFEAEVTVDNFDVMAVILERLGFHPFVAYEKYRTTYTLGEAEIVLDELPFGNFVEIEGTAGEIEAALRALKLDGRPRLLTSYMALFDQVKQALGLTVRDLTFANFEGVVVPPEVFKRGDYGV